MSSASGTNRQMYCGAQLAIDIQSEGQDVALSGLPSASLVEVSKIATNNRIDGDRSSHVNSACTSACTSNYLAHELGARCFTSKLTAEFLEVIW